MLTIADTDVVLKKCESHIQRATIENKAGLVATTTDNLDIYVSAHVDDCLIACKSKDIMTAFKKEVLTRFIGTDEGEVTEYLGCELIRNRSAKTAKLVQRGYAERVLRTFGMWDCKPCDTPLDVNSRLSKKDCPAPGFHSHRT